MAYKPDGYPDVSAYLLVEDIETETAFVQAAFDGQALRMVRNDSGVLIHGEIRIGDSVVMMGRAPGEAAAHVHLYVPDPDAFLARALAAGASLVQQMVEKGDGDRRGGVASTGGTVWWLARQVVPDA